MNSDSSMVQCRRPGCGIFYNPKYSSDACPHKWAGRSTPLLDELAAKLRRGERIKFEPWNPADHAHTGDLAATAAIKAQGFGGLLSGLEDVAAGRVRPMSEVDPTL